MPLTQVNLFSPLMAWLFLWLTALTGVITFVGYLRYRRARRNRSPDLPFRRESLIKSEIVFGALVFASVAFFTNAMANAPAVFPKSHLLALAVALLLIATLAILRHRARSDRT